MPDKCAKNIWAKKKIGCVIPCEGIFADVKKVPFEPTIAEISDMIPLDQYRMYKRFFQVSRG